MSEKQFPDFDGWTVTKNPNRNELVATKDGREAVRMMSGDLDRAYLTLKQDALAEDVRLDGTDDAKARFDEAAKALVIAKVREGLAKGFSDEYAFTRLRNAGCTVAEISSVMDGRE